MPGYATKSLALRGPHRYSLGMHKCMQYLTLLLLTAPLCAWAEDEPKYVFERDIAPLIDFYCVDCHSEKRLRGDLNLERFETQDQAIDSIAVWQRAAKRIVNNEMPPRSREQFTDEERQKVLDWIGSLNVDGADCAQLASEESQQWFPGVVMSRRLNRYEYENTVQDLLGIDIALAHLFPEDGAGGEGFDTHGSALYLSAIQIERYIDAAEKAVEAALPRDEGAAFTENWSPEEARQYAERRRQLIAATPNAEEQPRDAAFAALTSFMNRAWRRPIEPHEAERMLDLFDEAYARHGEYVEALKLPMKAVLISPHFLFLAEPEPAESGNYPLGGYPLASRLSYFIWGSMPDAELFALAGRGVLQDDEVLREQVLRMMRDPKADNLGDLFAAQWLGIRELGSLKKPDENRFPEFDYSLAEAMRRETSLFFAHLVREDRSLLELIDSDYTFANARLAEIYGLDGVSGDAMQLVQFADGDDSRGGVLGMAAVLTTTSHPLRTSPVLRGKWVLEQLLGDRMPPPPPDAGTLPEDDEHPEGLTLRQQLEAHRKNPDCASCHNRMDPLGFGLENFDPIGRWRDEQGGQPVDASGELPSGESFNGPRELRALLMAKKDAFAANLSRKMLGYALGRSLTRYDSCVIEDCMEALKASDYRPSALFTEIALSYPFRHRYSGGSAADADADVKEAK